MDTMTPGTPPAVVTDPTDDECPSRQATVQTWTCAVCGLDFAGTTVHPALSIVSLLPTPQLRTAALMAVLRTEVHRRSGKDPPP
ncbi:MAG: hypothetical protein ACRDTA_01440 [Pseudonocardiaceae bacterium]